MTIAKLINEIHAKGIKLWQIDGQLKFKASKEAWTDDIRDKIIANKEDIIAFLSQASKTSDIPPIEPVSRIDADGRPIASFPLSFAQERLWFIEQMEPDNTSYNLPGAVTISGDLNTEHLEQAFNLLIERHENLRTIFINEEGQGRQVILPSMDFKLKRIDLSQIENEATLHEQLQQLGQEEAATPFDLTKGPLLRGKLVKLGENEHMLMLTKHHIISDGWSMGIMIKELGFIMDCLGQGKRPELPPLPIQYLDYSVWQRKLLGGNSKGDSGTEQGSLLQQQLTYWQEKLKGVPESLNFATDYPRASVQDISGAMHTFSLDRSLTDKLKKLAEQQGGTLYMILLAAFNALLYRLTGQEDICLGSPVANRKFGETEGLIGLFINVLALRNQVQGDASFISLLAQVKETCLEAYKYQDTPFEKIVDKVASVRSTAINPIFQIMLGLHNERKELPGQNIRRHRLDIDTSKLDITISFTETPEGMDGEIVYKTSLFKPQSIERLAQHFGALCQSIVAAPDAQISDLEFISAAEKQLLLTEYNNTQADYPRDKCIHELFKEQVALNPDKPAVVCQGETLSFQQLYDKSLALALYLQSKGVKPDSLVGLCVERTPEMMVGILGILQAGGAYVPLDPDLPGDRLAYMLQDCQTPIVLTLEKLKNKLSDIATDETHVVALDQQWFQIQDVADSMRQQAALSQEVKPDNLAYVIYTSGSTGQPKGVMIEHRMVVDYCYSVFRKMDLQHCDTFAAVSTFSADLGNISIYVPILFSKTIHLFSNDYVNYPHRLKDYFDCHPIDCMKITPSHFEMFKMSDTEIVASSKVLIFAGEPLTQRVVEIVNTLQPDCKVYNNYGPTETTISKLSTSELKSSELSSIYLGKPLDNTLVYILDRNNKPVPVGVPGELHIAGDGVARGYLNRPELTQEKFIANPFAHAQSGEGSRMYKSGDLVRWLDDGNIEYLGRTDNQVKIRGFRIEVGEIEERLNQYPQIQDAVVVAQGEASDKKLIAFYVASNTKGEELVELDNEMLRAWLQQSLPDYMLPMAFVSLEGIPLTPNGKVDRNALARKDISLESKEAYVAPRNAREKQLVAIWSDILNLEAEKIGINDNFFELGGDSIKIIQVIYTASQHDIHFDINDMFDYQSIRELMENCDTSGSREIISEDGILEGEVQLGPVQAHFFEHAQTDVHHYNQSILLNLNVGLSTEDLQSIVTALARQHDVLRLRFTKTSNGWQQRYLGSVPDTSSELGIHSYDIAAVQQDQIADYVKEVCNQWQSSLDLENGPIMRWIWFDSKGNSSDQLAIIIHHLAVDGVSWRILLEDLNHLIGQQLTRKPLQLSDKRSSYRDWVNSLAAYKDSEQGQKDLGFWIEQSQKAQGLDNALESKTWRNDDILDIRVQLSKSSTQKLLKHCHQAYGTDINDLLLTAVVLSYCQATGNDGLMLDLEGHGREQLDPAIDITKTLGWFTSIYPVIFQLSNPQDIGQSIKEIKSTLHEIPNKGVGFSVFRYINRHESVQSIPEAQVVFNFLGDFQSIEKDSGGNYFSLSEQATGDAISRQKEVNKPVKINGLVAFEQLSFTFKYPKEWKEQPIGQWQTCFIEALEALIEHCCDAPRLGYTPDDFPLLSASLSQLDDLIPDLAQQWNVELNNIQDIYPLTPLQSGILFETLYAQTEDNKGMYLTQSAIGINGRVDIQALRRAWQLVVNHYDALRMQIFTADVSNINTSLQMILRHVNAEIDEVNWSEKTDAELKSACEDWMQKSKRSGISFEQGALMRMTLFSGQTSSCLLFEQHHIVMDGWAKGIVLSNLFKAYQALVQRQEYQLPETAPFRAYVASLLNRDSDKDASYWKDYLCHYDEKTPLPMMNLKAEQREAKKAFETVDFYLSEDATKQLEQLIKTHRLTMNTVLQFIWALMLHLHSGNKVVTFGSVSSGRTGILDIKHSDQIVGLCINTTPTCIGFDANRSLLEQLKQMQIRESEKLNFETTSLVEIQQMLGNNSNEDFFQTLFVYENYPVERIAEADSLINSFNGDETPNYPLTIKGAAKDKLSISFTYDGYYYEKQTVVTLTEQFERLTLQLIASPDAAIKDLSLLTPEQKQQVLTHFNATQADYPQDKCIHDLFQEQVAVNPDKTAVVYENESLSYQQLYDRSHALALYLQSQGVTPDTMVGLCVERSIEMMVGILGILQAGGAYVPLDPDYPQERLAYMLADCQTALVLTQEALLPKLSEVVTQDTTLIALDGQWAEIEQCAAGLQSEGISLERNGVREMNSEHLAYVIYTSGSTGQPKGVMTSHRAVNRLVKNTNFIAISDEDTFLQFASLSFDAATLEIWGPLLNGGKLVIAPRGKDAVEHLGELIARYQISVLWLTSGLFQSLVKDNVAQLAGLRVLLSGGDVVPVDTTRKFLEHCPDSIFINGYGPTENTTFTCCYVVTEALPDDMSSLPIGSPIANTQVYILDQYQQPVPVGVPGELYIAGDGLARGYLNQPELTAEKFITNPFMPGSKLYRSGDMVRWRENGTIDYLGRIDTQVKIRGFRIETGEIENQLKQHPGIKDAVVVPQGSAGDKQLLACYVAKNSKEGELVQLSNEELKAQLRKNLPEHMLPAVFVSLAAIPLTANGKVDRRKLAAMDVSAESDADYVAPRNQTEYTLVGIWSEVLKLAPENIGINDSFFDLGGNSLLVTQVIAKIHSQLDIKIPMKALFSANTIAGVAEVCQVIKVQQDNLLSNAERTDVEFEEVSL
ncbi:amino acid adenylation domain-containing protein [Paraneptunicella aestuarii]|uniref:non-ribosomal peptide synthetase n=1 Tax=Paraneptunicella aestuarii TaxID=2831148 RepID=UPI001E5296A2|nr:non-ribosomal peptide synthetase [Paraneptunicella aestuarii]UAA39459.1 amino acid adenylation domain-containing protein [Paraneptunicella aestuarii]